MMTMHPNPNQVVAHTVPTSTNVVASAPSRASSSSAALKGKPNDIKTKLGAEPVATIEISEAGRQLSAHTAHKIASQTEAKAQLSEVSKQLKLHAKEAVNIHSNLRALKINHLIYD